MKVTRLLLFRAMSALLSMLLIATLVFFIINSLPGDAATRILGRSAEAESLEKLRHQLLLDRPVLERYGLWLADAARGDFGNSLINKRPVFEILWPKIQNTLILSGAALALYIPLCLIPAFFQARRSGSRADDVVSYIVLIFLSVPDFLLATLFLIVFGIVFPVLPTSALVDTTTTAVEWIRILVMPALTLAILMAVYAVRMLRENLIAVLESDYVRYARLKGLRETQVLLRHALPNAIAPTLNITALNIGYLVGGVVVIEKVFGFPGFGSQVVDSLQLRDVPMIQATVILSAAVYICANLMADAVTIILNPRLRS